MMPKAYKKAVATIGKYTKDGVEKKRYLQIGTLFQQDDGGFSLKLDAVPVGPEWSGWVSFYDLDKKSSEPKDDESEIPF
jgi:hypothetical protein